MVLEFFFFLWLWFPRNLICMLQVEEETCIQLNKKDMVYLTAFLHPSIGGKVFPSPVSRSQNLLLSFIEFVYVSNEFGFVKLERYVHCVLT